MERSLDLSEVTRAKLGKVGIVCPDLWTLRLVLRYVPSRMSLCPDFALSTIVCSIPDVTLSGTPCLVLKYIVGRFVRHVVSYL